VNNIRFLKRKEIDDRRWNETINASVNSLPYALTWYLDAVSENWDALVLNDYDAVMPLVWLRKFGIKCLYQPYYCQQLGLFSTEKITAGLYRDFLQTASTQFSYIHINLNPSAALVAEKFALLKKKNLLLPLGNDHASLQKEYSGSHKRNITKAQKASLVFSTQCDLKSFQKFYLENVNHTKENFKPKHEKIFKKLTQLLITNGHGVIFTARDTSNNLQASVLLVIHKKRLIGIINTSSASGKKQGASHFLFDHIIQKFSGSEFILDFEGSSIATIARFYEGFGAIEEIFYCFKNTLLKNISQRFT
jgi:hypothetical protein